MEFAAIIFWYTCKFILCKSVHTFIIIHHHHHFSARTMSVRSSACYQ